MRLIKTILASTTLLAPVLVTAGPLVNINTADRHEMVSELASASNTTAAAIVDYREKNGRFESVNDLLKVEGVEREFININQDYLHLGDDPRLKEHS